MKKLALFFMIALVITACAQNLEELKANHIKKMNDFGHAYLLNNRDAKMIFMNVENSIASACLTEDMGTAYMEKEGKKLYWSIKKEGECIVVTIKFELKGEVFTKSYKICKGENTMNITLENTDRLSLSCDKDCLISKAPGCIACLINWMCWLGCAATAVLKCCDIDW